MQVIQQLPLFNRCKYQMELIDKEVTKLFFL